jgi:hypothetical protein
MARKPRRPARNHPAVPVNAASVGIRNSILGISRQAIARRAGGGTWRMIGPITKPMNRSIPVHSTPQKI